MTSKSTGFPICVILYKRDSKGTTYNEILNRAWQTKEGKIFCFNKDTINNYISKYPSKYMQPKADSIFFYTIRDINALKRCRTFIEKPCGNAIIIDKSKMPYYCYVDVFKEYASHLPYYWGNFDIFIDNENFEQIKNEFLKKSVQKHIFLQKMFPMFNLPPDEAKIKSYFDRLFA